MRRTAEDTEKTRQALLDTAARVFAQDGFDGTSLEAIAQAAGMTRGAIYWHFKDKQALFDQIVGREDDRLDRITEAALDDSLTAWKKLGRLITVVLDNFYDNEVFRQQIVLTWYRMNSRQFKPVMASKSIFVKDFLALMESLLTEARQAGEIRGNVDPHVAALHLSALINGIYRLHHVALDWVQDKETARRLFDEYLEFLSQPASTTPNKISK